MSVALPYLIAVALIAVVFLLPAWLAFRKEEASARKDLERAKAAGRTEPVSIRPWIDPSKCMGSGSCVKACPEKGVLRVVDGRARLVEATTCVGHGACVDACPTGAVELAFGSERRGVDLPRLAHDFQTNVPGLYVAGELGGMGLIANAVEQGRQTARRALAGLAPGELDLVVVGAGPAGISAALEALRMGRKVALLEQDEFGGAIRHYPRGKLVMSRGFKLSKTVGVVPGTLRKEELVEVLETAIAEAQLKVFERERVDAIQPTEAGFEVKTSARTLRASRVILAVGRRGTPRRLEVPGEDQEKVAYRLLEPDEYQHLHVLVVGGGDSAAEAAVALAEQPGCRVSLSFRTETLSQPKEANRDRVAEAQAAGRLRLLPSTNVRSIGADRVHLAQGEEEVVLPNDKVFVFAGGVLPSGFLQACGIELERHFGKRIEEVPKAPTRAGREAARRG